MAGMDAVTPVVRTEMPPASYIMSAEGYQLATYAWGEPDGEPVLCVHGFASSCRDNWVETGWVRMLTGAGYRVIGVDQRGHGASDKPDDPLAYSMGAFVADLIAVLDTYLVDDVRYLGYSLGARVGWQLAVDAPEHVSRAVLGGIPDGRPLGRLRIEQARAYAEKGIPVEDKVTQNYLTLAERVRDNDLRALIALAEGMRFGDADPDPERPPTQPVLFATGSEDAILERSRVLAASVPRGTFVEIPGRHHFNAPGSRAFRDAGLAFLSTDGETA